VAEAGASERYKKIVINPDAVDRLMVDHFIQSNPQQPAQIILDLDVTDDLIHGNQEGRFFHGYYGNYCYLPLYIFCGEFLLCARLRSADGCAWQMGRPRKSSCAYSDDGRGHEDRT